MYYKYIFRSDMVKKVNIKKLKSIKLPELIERRITVLKQIPHMLHVMFIVLYDGSMCMNMFYFMNV